MKITARLKVLDHDGSLCPVAVQDEEKWLWTWDRKQQCFWRNEPLTQDYHWGSGREGLQEMEYEELSEAEFQKLLAEGPELTESTRRIFEFHKNPRVLLEDISC